MADQLPAPSPTRVVAYARGENVDTSRAFYTDVLGFEVVMEDPVLGLTSPANRSAQVVIPPAGFEDPEPRFGIDLGEPWGVRRFFVEDPGGTIINVLAHTAA